MTDALILSNALDTNGQNARYVRAAEKHGMHLKVVEALAIGNVDPGGVVARLQEASVKHPEMGLRIRSAHKQDQYFQFAGDLRWGFDAPREQRTEVRRLAQSADVIHLNNSDRGLFELGMSKSKKPCLLHHHGSLFRNNPERMLGIAKNYGMIQAVSTVDLQRYQPDVLPWLPTAYDIEAIRRTVVKRRDHDKVRIGHFPTSRDLKHTDLFIVAIKELMAEGLPIELVPADFLTEKKDWLPRWEWERTMIAKARCDIVYDQLAYGYGCNSVEAWAMGKPVIAGADDWTLQRMSDLWGYIPFQVATPATLKAIIKAMVLSKDLRTDAAARGLYHVTRHHDELPALEKLAELYHDAIAIRHKPRIEGKGVTFYSNRTRTMTVDGVNVPINKEGVVVTDVKVVAGLRKIVQQRPMFGITEGSEDVA